MKPEDKEKIVKLTEKKEGAEMTEKEKKNKNLTEKKPEKESLIDILLKATEVPDEDWPEDLEEEPKRESFTDRFLKAIRLPDEELEKELKELEELEDEDMENTSVIEKLLSVLLGVLLVALLLGWSFRKEFKKISAYSVNDPAVYVNEEEQDMSEFSTEYTEKIPDNMPLYI